MSERVTIYPEEMTQRASEFPREWEFNQVQAQLLKEFPMTAVAAWTAIQRTKRIDDKITRIPIRKR